jgi:tetratricopeptide (TPR) repeat protein
MLGGKMTRIGLISAAALIAVTLASPPAFAQMSGFNWTNETDDNTDYGRCAQGEKERAERALRSCGRLIGERYSTAVTAGAYYFRARIYYRLHDPERARADLERAYDYFTITVNTNRRVPDSYANRAVILYWLERYDEAIADYDRAIAVAGASNDSSGTRVRSNVADRRAGQLADLHYARANVFFRRGDWTSAIAGYDQAAALDPDDGDFQEARCEGRAAANADLETAAQACEAAISLSDGEDGHFSRGFLHFTQGRYDQLEFYVNAGLRP